MSSKLGSAIVGMVVVACLSRQASAQSYLPGPPPTVGAIQHQTVSPYNPSRTTIGIGESVNCGIDASTWQDTDIYVDPYGNQTYVSDTMGTITWMATGAGSVYPIVGNSTTLTANLTDADAAVTVQATIPDSGTEGIDAPLVRTLAFAVKAPAGFMILSVKDDKSFGTPAPPNNLIAFSHEFTNQITPNTVDYSALSFRENIPATNWTWPDGTAGSIKAHTVQFNAFTENNGDPNHTLDSIYSGTDGAYGVGLLGNPPKDFTYTISVPLEYYDGAKWVQFYPKLTHDKSYRGATLDGRATANADNTTSGGWMGPWKSIP